MSDFDPRKQVFYLLAADGETQVPVPLDLVTEMHYYDLGNAINFGSQAGACIMLLVVALCMLPRLSLVKFSQWLQLCTLAINIVRQILFAAHFTSPWNESFAVFADDWSHITQSDFVTNAATETLSLLIAILVQILLCLQAWAMVNLLSLRWKWILAVGSALISLAVVSMRLMAAVLRIQFLLALSDPTILRDKAFTMANLLQTTSIFWYCTLFNTKLALHLVQHRGVLPSRHGLSAIEVLVITNGLLMFAPVILCGLSFNTWIRSRLEIGSLILTLVIVILTLGTLIAQRMCGPQASSDRGTGDSGSSAGRTFKFGSSSAGSAYPGIVTSHAEASPRPRRADFAHDSIEAELRQIDSVDDVEKAGVRVNQEFERRVERA